MKSSSYVRGKVFRAGSIKKLTRNNCAVKTKAKKKHYVILFNDYYYLNIFQLVHETTLDMLLSYYDLGI